MKGIRDVFKNKEDIQSIIDGISLGLKEQLVSGISGSARSLFISTLQEEQKRQTLIVTHQLLHAQQIYDDLTEFSDDKNVYIYPVNELIASEMAITSPELRAERIKGLTEWLQSGSGILIAPIAALKRKLPPISYWKKYQILLKDDTSIQLDNVIASLVEMGYERVDMVTSPAEFSIRGGIIDIYSVTEYHPVRIELFDDEIESIRFFDADTQRSLYKLQEIMIKPATELLLTTQDYLRAADRLENLLSATLHKMKASEDKEKLISHIQSDLERLKNTESFQGMYKYSELFYENPTSLLDYVPEKNGLLIFDELGRIQDTAQTLDVEEAELHRSLLEQNEMVQNVSISFDWHSIREKMTQQRIYMSIFLRHIPNTQPENIVNLSIHPRS